MFLAAPRLSGALLSAVCALARTGPGAKLLWGQMGRDYGLGALMGLPPSARGELELEPRPQQAAAPREWEDQGFAVPSSERCTGDTLRRAYVAGACTPLEVLTALKARVEAADFGDATHSPFICCDWERAFEAAQESTDRYQSGSVRSRLDGVPIPIKDEHAMRGLVTAAGTAYVDAVAEQDSTLVARLRERGALLYAKTHTTEWGMNPWGMNPHFTYPRNVYGSEHGAGGSSTGAGVAVGLGLATVAVGSDGGGSIRIPAAFNGVFGLKPTFGRIGRGGSLFGCSSVSHFGPLAASVSDCVDFLLETALGTDPLDPPTFYSTDHATAAEAWARAPGRGVRGCRIGIMRSEMEAADTAVRNACLEALRALESEGAVLVDVDVGLSEHALAVGVLSIATETMAGLIDDYRAHGRLMGGDLQLLLDLMARASAKEYLIARRTRPMIRAALKQTIANVDVLALPTTCTVAPKYAASEQGIAIADDLANQNACRLNFLGNITGLPAGSVPVGMHEGLPIGLQVMGDAWDEASVIAVMTHCERLGLSGLPLPKSSSVLLP